MEEQAEEWAQQRVQEVLLEALAMTMEGLMLMLALLHCPRLQRIHFHRELVQLPSPRPQLEVVPPADLAAADC